MTLDELFGTFTVSAFRLEAQQEYRVEGDEERRRAFREGRPLPPPRPAKIEDMAMVREVVRSGRRVHRVHVVDFPLSDYVRYELACYPENIESGEGVRIADRAAHPGLRSLDTDFWLFDSETDHASVIWFRYTPEGVCTSRDYSTDPAGIRRAIHQRDLVINNSLLLSDFLLLPGVR